jgi:hypothetical protein
MKQTHPSGIASADERLALLLTLTDDRELALLTAFPYMTYREAKLMADHPELTWREAMKRC